MRDEIGIEERRLPITGAQNPRRALDEAIGVLLAHLQRGRRLQQAQLLHHIQQQIGDLVDAIAAIGAHAANVDLRKISVSAAFRRGHAHLGRRGLVVKLDPEALQQLFRRFAGERPLRQPARVEGQQMLIQASRAEGVPGVELRGHAQVNEPVRLQRLPEVAGCVRGDARTHLGDAQQFDAALRIGFRRSETARRLSVALREADQRSSRDAHRFELLLPRIGFGIVEIIQRSETRINPRLEIQHAGVVDLVIHHRVARRALLHELGEDTRVVGCQPLRRHLLEKQLAHGFPLPEGNHRLGIRLARLWTDFERRLLPRIEDIEVFQRVAAEFGEGGRSFGGGAFLAHNQLAGIDADSLMLQEIGERLRALYRRGAQPGGLPIKRGQQLRALGGQRLTGLKALLAQSTHTVGHGHELSSFLRD